LTSSLEDYLEAIFEIISEREAVRPKDIAARLDVSQPSVTGALRSLADKKLIHYEPYGIITLTPQGRAIAQEVAGKHVILRDFLTKILLIDAKEANEVACRMEHVMPEPTMERLASFATYVEEHAKRCPSWTFSPGRKTRRR
jgi:DtxR family Mn-dependent transcriptional regulator